LSRSWGLRGTRPRRIRQRQFKSSYLFAAVCPRKDKGVALVLPYANAEAMQLHLNEISKKIAHNYHAILVMDNAGWHLSQQLIIPDNITIISLPPYSPELNPVEQLFQQLRKLKLSNACYNSYAEIDKACAEAWNSFIVEKGNIKKLCMREWANAY